MLSKLLLKSACALLLEEIIGISTHRIIMIALPAAASEWSGIALKEVGHSVGADGSTASKGCPAAALTIPRFLRT